MLPHMSLLPLNRIPNSSAALPAATIDSLNELHPRYSGVLLATAFRVLNNVKDAEEVVQEAFVQIWEKAASYDERRGKPLTWAMTLTRNKAIDRLRRVQRRNRLHDEVEQEAQIWDHVVRARFLR